jgi:hypothetical protein
MTVCVHANVVKFQQASRTHIWLPLINWCMEERQVYVSYMLLAAATTTGNTAPSLVRTAADSLGGALDDYVKTLNRSRSICNGSKHVLHVPTSVMVVTWRPLQISAAGRPRGWPPQRPLQMWTSGNGLLKRLLHEFSVTDVK